MPTITYNIPISPSSTYFSDADITFRTSEISNDRFKKVLVDNSADHNISELGWGNKNSVWIDEEIYVSPGAVYLTEDSAIPMSGGIEIVPEISEGGFYHEVSDESDSVSVLVYKNTNGNKSIYKMFTEGVGDWTYETNISGVMEEEEEVDEAYSITIPIKNPIRYSNISQYRADYTFEDYAKSKANYLDFLEDKELSLEYFLDICEKVSYDNYTLREVGATGFAADLKLKYFPVCKDVTVLIETEDGITQVSEYTLVSTEGSISITSDSISASSITAIYIFYGILPLIRINKAAMVDISEVESYKNIVLLEKDSSFDYINPFISKSSITVNMGDGDSESAILRIPKKYSSYFVETDVPVFINGTMIYPDAKRSFTNLGINTISVSQPTSLLDIATDIKKLSNTTYELKNFLPRTLASIYAVYDIDGVEKISHVMFSRKVYKNRAIETNGYGRGGYGSGGYGSDALLDDIPGTTILYTEPNPDNFSMSMDKMSFDYNIDEWGNTIILPTYPKEDTIKVSAIGESGNYTEFKDFKFQSPDIVVLDKDKVRSGYTYNIEFVPKVHPLMTTLRIYNGVVSSESLVKVSAYQNFVKLISIHSKYANIKFGYYDNTGAPVYFDTTLRADLIISDNAIIGITSKFKNIELQG